MPRYVAKRLLTGLLTAFIVSLILFAILRAAQGNEDGWIHRVNPPLMIVCLGGCPSEDELTNIREDLGLNRPPIHIQYIDWIGGWVTGNWEKSIWSQYSTRTRHALQGHHLWGQPVWEHFVGRLPVTLQLVVMSQAIAALIGVPAGIIMAMTRDSWTDRLGRAIAKSWLGFHMILSATLLLFAGLFWLNWSPRIGHIPLLEDPLGNLDQFLFPAIALGYAGCAAVALMTRYYALDVFTQQHFVQTTPVFGPRLSLSVFLHTMRNALAPAIVISGLTFPTIVGGVVIVEPLLVWTG